MKGLSTHSSVLAWRIPWTEEPGELQSTGFTESDTTVLLSTHTMAVPWVTSPSSAGGCGLDPGLGS